MEKVDESRRITIDTTKIDREKIVEESVDLIKNLKTLAASMASLIEDAPEAVGLCDIGVVVSIAAVGTTDFAACFGAGKGIIMATSTLCDSVAHDVMHDIIHNRDESEKDSKENNG